MLAPKLLALVARVVHLLPIARDHYYHPSQMGSWSIKKVLPAARPHDPALDYANLDGVQHGGAAMEAFIEAIHPDTTSARKGEIEDQLTEYCKLDTYAMVKLWGVFLEPNPRGYKVNERGGIEKFKIPDGALSGLTPLLTDVNPKDRKESYGKAHTELQGKVIPAVYFWTMGWNGSSYGIYIGKSVNVIGRLSNYTGRFQPQSPNNFKICYFYDFMKSEFAGSTLNLYYQPHYSLGSKELHIPENEMLKKFKPLINSAGSSGESRKLIEDGFRSAYRESFEAALRL